MKQLSSITIIGAGRLGTALGCALAARGYHIETVVSQRLATARRAVRLIARAAPRLSNTARTIHKPRALSLHDAPQLTAQPTSAWLFITTPDGAIEETAAHIAKLPSFHGPRRPRLAWHTSGALSSEVLTPLRAAGYAVGSLHPLLSVSDAVSGAATLPHAHFCLEGQPLAVRAARRLVKSLGAHHFTISPAHKTLYHAAAVMACGHLVALFDLASATLHSCGVPEKTSRALLHSLVASTVANLGRATPAQALTGPFARTDAGTVANHLHAFDESALTDARAVYVLLGRHALLLAREAGAKAEGLAEIEQLLINAEARTE